MDRRFLGIMSAIVLIFVGIFIISLKKNPTKPTLGIQHPEQSRTHIQSGQSHPAYNSDPPSSGPHYNDASAPTQWGVYTQEVPEEVFIHNEEHGGIIITYKPGLAASQLKKLQALFTPPYSRKNFSPIKAIVTPRSKDKHLIELAAWRYTLNLDNYNEDTIVDFYLQHVSQSPESTAGPYNTPINQAH